MAQVKPLIESDPLDRLPTLVNDVLIQIGRVFRDQSLRDSKLSSLDAKAKNQQAIPRANLEFHEILDDIEVEIENAKAVFERDLALIRAKRAERERAAGLSRLPPTAEPKTAETGLAPPVVAVAVRQHGHTNQEPLDVEMTDAAPFTDDEQETSAPKSPFTIHVEALLQPAETASASSERARTTGANITQATTSSIPAPIPIPTTTTTIPPLTTSLPPTPLSATFASMFPDPSPNDPFGPPDQSDFDFEIDFSSMADAAGAPGAADLDLSTLNGPTDTATTNGTAPQNPAAAAAAAATSAPAIAAAGDPGTAEDINSLLPGLDSFVNSGGDFDMLDLGDGADDGAAAAVVAAAAAADSMPALDASAFSTAGPADMAGILPNPTTMTTTSAIGELEQPLDAGAAGNSFDDLFSAMDTGMNFEAALEDAGSAQHGAEDGGAGDDMVDFEGVGEFDETWFS